MSNDITPFERIRRVGPAGNEFWSGREFSLALGYNDYRNFEAVVEKARTACFNSGQRVDDHFVEITEMVEIGSVPTAESLKRLAPKAKKTKLKSGKKA